jgi:hypothetical protein
MLWDIMILYTEQHHTGVITILIDSLESVWHLIIILYAFWHSAE